MAVTGCDEQVVATAESLKGESTFAPLAGLFTVTLANAGREIDRINEPMNESWYAELMKFLCGMGRVASTGECKEPVTDARRFAG
jgi:hypothetical protein